MICPKCNNDMDIQVINQVKLVDKHHGIIWWLLIGWWWFPLKWLVFTLPALIFAIFGHKKQKTINKIVKVAVCKNCGYSTKIK